MKLRVLVGLATAVLMGATSPAFARDTVSDGQWFHAFIRSKEANSISRGEGVVVAVVDSGVDASHPDLADSVLAGINLTGGGDGRQDTNGHGTAMAGLIAAHGRVNGIAPRAKILPVKVGSDIDQNSRAAEGIEWAASQGARVISISLSGPSEDHLLTQIVNKAMASDIVVVAGAGNTDKSPTGKVGYPAAIPGVVAVAGVDKYGNHSSISVTGPEIVISAPSDNISSTGLKGEYNLGTGTSDATAIVAGAAALIRSKYPTMKATEVVRRLTATATDKGAPGRDPEYGYGVLNLVAALTAELPQESASAVASAVSSSPGGGSSGSGSGTQVVVLVVGGVVILGGILALLLWRRRGMAQ